MMILAMTRILNTKEEAFLEALADLMKEHGALISASESCIEICVDYQFDNIITLPQDEVFNGGDIKDFISENS